jgi:hypothetical protein
MPGAWLARSLACNKESTRAQSPQVRRNIPAFPARLVLTACFVLSPEIGLIASVPAQRTSVVATLISASRYQDHTTSPSASNALVSRVKASIASRTDVRDDRDTPLLIRAGQC